MGQILIRKASSWWLTFALYMSVANATFWTVTSRFVASYSTTVWDSTPTVFTLTLHMASTASPRVTPTATSSYEDTLEDLSYIDLYYPVGAVDAADIVTTITSNDRTNPYLTTYYAESVTYTAPASCPTSFAVSTWVTVDVPTDARSLVTPTATSSTTYTNSHHTTVTEVTYFAAPSALPPLTLSDNLYYSMYIQHCINPMDTPLGPGSGDGSGSSGSSGDDDLEVCSLMTGCTSLHTWIIVIATVLPSLFVLGFAESFFWYRRLMIGRGTLRFGTVCWVLISIWVLCFTRRQDARSPAAQEVLRRQWNEMSARSKWANWWRWGFRHAYPVRLLGDPAEDRRAAAAAKVADEGTPRSTTPAIPLVPVGHQPNPHVTDV